MEIKGIVRRRFIIFTLAFILVAAIVAYGVPAIILLTTGSIVAFYKAYFIWHGLSMLVYAIYTIKTIKNTLKLSDEPPKAIDRSN